MTTLTDRRNETRVNVRIPLKFKLIGRWAVGSGNCQRARLSV
jgi:hypothetical protein